MQRVFVCPEVKAPKLDRVNNTERKRKDFTHNRGSREDEKSFKKPKSAKAELREFMTSVKEYSSQTLEGLSKKAHKDDKLTKLGAPPPKQQTMPFKMKMGILAGRKKRKQREAAMAAEAGVVQANAKLAKSKHSQLRKGKR